MIGRLARFRSLICKRCQIKSSSLFWSKKLSSWCADGAADEFGLPLASPFFSRRKMKQKKKTDLAGRGGANPNPKSCHLLGRRGEERREGRGGFNCLPKPKSLSLHPFPSNFSTHPHPFHLFTFCICFHYASFFFLLFSFFAFFHFFFISFCISSLHFSVHFFFMIFVHFIFAIFFCIYFLEMDLFIHLFSGGPPLRGTSFHVTPTCHPFFHSSDPTCHVFVSFLGVFAWNLGALVWSGGGSWGFEAIFFLIFLYIFH